MRESPLRIVLADDSAAFRAGFRAALAGNQDVTVVGEAGDGDEALRAAAALQPDVVVMDLSMPGIDGIEATRRLVQRSPHIAVLVPHHVRRRRVGVRRHAGRCTRDTS